MDQNERNERFEQLMLEEMEKNELAWYWLSFADEEKFNVAALIRAFGPMSAVVVAKRADDRTTGEVQIVRLPDWSEWPQVNGWLRVQPTFMDKEQAVAFEERMDKLMMEMN